MPGLGDIPLLGHLFSRTEGRGRGRGPDHHHAAILVDGISGVGVALAGARKSKNRRLAIFGRRLEEEMSKKVRWFIALTLGLSLILAVPALADAASGLDALGRRAIRRPGSSVRNRR